MHVVGLVLHPERDCSGAVASILDWATRRRIEVLGVDTEVRRLQCAAEAVPAEELAKRADLIVSLGGDGTMLRAMRLADRHGSGTYEVAESLPVRAGSATEGGAAPGEAPGEAPVEGVAPEDRPPLDRHCPILGVNLGKLGFLAEVDVPDLESALCAIDDHRYAIEPRLAVDAVISGHAVTAFNDIAFVRFPGQRTVAIAVLAAGKRFVGYAADAVVVATPTGSTAYSFSAGGPIVSPAVEGLLVTPAAPHSAYNRGLVLSLDDELSLDILPASGPVAVEADGIVAANVAPGDRIDLNPRPGAAHVVRLGRTTFYERVRRKLHLTDSAELSAT